MLSSRSSKIPSGSTHDPACQPDSCEEGTPSGPSLPRAERMARHFDTPILRSNDCVTRSTRI